MQAEAESGPKSSDLDKFVWIIYPKCCQKCSDSWRTSLLIFQGPRWTRVLDAGVGRWTTLS